MLAALGRTYADLGIYDPYPVTAELERQAADWQLLLQLDSDEAARMNWQASSGLVYFCMTREALRARDFDAVCEIASAVTVISQSAGASQRRRPAHEPEPGL